MEQNIFKIINDISDIDYNNSIGELSDIKIGNNNNNYG